MSFTDVLRWFRSGCHESLMLSRGILGSASCSNRLSSTLLSPAMGCVCLAHEIIAMEVVLQYYNLVICLLALPLCLLSFSHHQFVESFRRRLISSSEDLVCYISSIARWIISLLSSVGPRLLICLEEVSYSDKILKWSCMVRSHSRGCHWHCWRRTLCKARGVEYGCSMIGYT